MGDPVSISRFHKAAALALILAALSAASCKSATEQGPANPNAVTISSSADAKRLLPMLASESVSSMISGLVFNGLVKYDPNLMLVGDLAESWVVNNDGLEITFNLRKGVKWHDGAEFTSADVVFTYQKVTDPLVPTAYAENYGPVSSVEAVDDYTVRVTYKEPFAPALESWAMGIIPRHLLEGKDISLDEFNRTAVVGTGPYTIKQWDSGQKIILEAYPDYFEGRPGVEKFIMRVIPDPATTFLELRTSGVDYMQLTPTQYQKQTTDEFFTGRFNKFRYPSFAYTYLGYNLRNDLFKDARVRRAITHAIDKAGIINGVLMGLGSPCTGPFPAESWAYSPEVKDLAYDPARAEALFKEAGWTKGEDGVLERKGRRLSFTVITNQGNDQRLKTAQILAESLRKVGVEMEIKVLEWQAMLNYIEERKYEAVLMGWQLSRDPDLYDIWHSSKTGPNEFNFISYSNKEVDMLLLEGRRTFDIERRKAIYRRVHEILVEEQPYSFLYVPDSLPILHKRFKGVHQSPIGIWYDLVNWKIPQDRAQWYE